MIQEEILQYNKRCAEFLGVDIHHSVEVYKDSKSPLRQYIHNCPKSKPLLFHSDWNWIMEVVEAINKTQNPKQGGDTTHSTLKREVQTLLGKAAKKAVVQAINQFLIWYEQNKK